MKLTRSEHPLSLRICHDTDISITTRRAIRERKAYAIYVLLQDADCGVCYGRLTVGEKVVPDAPATYWARLRSTAGSAVRDELLHGASYCLAHIFGVDTRFTETLCDGEPHNELHDDIAVPVGHEGKIHDRNVDGSVGDCVHSKRDTVLRERHAW